MKLPTLFLAFLLTGCATCREHPIACSVAGAVLVTSVALSVNRDGSNPAAHSIARRMSPCEPIGVTPCGP